MKRNVSAHLELDAAAPAQLVLAIAASQALAALETLEIRQGDRLLDPAEVTEIADDHDTRLHLVDVAAGPVTIDYRLEVDCRIAPRRVDAIEEARYLRPSRYCESDSLGPVARAEFSGLVGEQLLAGVSSWVGDRLAYVPGSSLPTDGAVQTLLSRRGVCRDYAHLVVAFLRALDVPARLVSVYAPGLYPMDFHAVAEAAIDGVWRVVDATTLAPRSSLVRIATGRDAADTAFLSNRGGAISLRELEVMAIVDELPNDDVEQLVSLG